MFSIKLIVFFIVSTSLFNVFVEPNQYISSDAENSFEEHMIHYVGAFNYIIDESDESFLQNGTYHSTYDDPCIFMCKRYMSVEAYRSSVLSFGQHKSFSNIDTILEHNEPFTMVVLGGSVSCAKRSPHSRWHPDSTDEYLPNAWPTQLEGMLRKKHKSSNITMTNLCMGAVGSNIWVDKMLEWRNDPYHIIFDADLIFVETAVNDEGLDTNRYGLQGDPIKQETEMLIRLLKLLPKKPYLIWVGASSRTNNPSESILSQLNVTVPYLIPLIDIVHSFVPLQTPLQFYWYNNIFKVDVAHLTKTGNRILAFYIFTFMNQLIKEKVLIKDQYPNLKLCETNKNLSRNVSCQSDLHNTSLNPPLFISENSSLSFETSRPYNIDFRYPYNLSHVVESRGFNQSVDHSDKLGYIGYNIGDYFVIRFTPEEIRSHFQSGQIIIEFLKSYEDIGSMSISIRSTSITSASKDFCEMANVTELSYKEIDCTWNKNISVSDSERFEVIDSNLKYRNRCLYINITIIASKLLENMLISKATDMNTSTTASLKSVNKIKVLHAAIF